MHSSPKKIEAAKFAGHHLNPDEVVRLTNKFKELFMVVGTWRRRKRKRVREIRTLLSGGARRNRTADLLNAIQALSQLSYGPEFSTLRRALYVDGGGAATSNFQVSRSSPSSLALPIASETSGSSSMSDSSSSSASRSSSPSSPSYRHRLGRLRLDLKIAGYKIKDS